MREFDEFVKEAGIVSKLKARKRAYNSPEYKAALDRFSNAAEELDAAFAERKTNPVRYDRAASALNRADEEMRTILKNASTRSFDEFVKEAAGYEEGLKTLGRKMDDFDRFKLFQNFNKNRAATAAHINSMDRLREKKQRECLQLIKYGPKVYGVPLHEGMEIGKKQELLQKKLNGRRMLTSNYHERHSSGR